MNGRQICTMGVLLFLVAACDEPAEPEPVESKALQFVGSDRCQSCHVAEYQEWRGSHHQLAMQVANTESVLGDFSGVDFDYFGTQAAFKTQDGKFLVSTENADGVREDFVVSHTFGVEPLQQYLVEFPDGRVQALPFAWDSRPRPEGGQRWFHLNADEYIAPTDPLHWTGRFYNWNYMCAECHSTDVHLGYDMASDSFNTTFEEVSVGCESCHGRGSRHIDQANAAAMDEHFGLELDLDDRRGASWVMNIETGIAERHPADGRQQQPESCGRCHARRSVLTEDYEYGKRLTDTHMPSLLEENLYFADGRILDEVYVYGSFVQSKMYAAGVTCSDCHNPHTGNLRTGDDPNQVCSQCHLPARFATLDHQGDDSPNCVSCHMPTRTYMGVDDRRDHSFRLPGAGEQPQHYGNAIEQARAGPANDAVLDALSAPALPPIARATLLTLLSPPASDHEMAVLQSGLTHEDPLVRIAALRTLGQQSAERRLQAGSHLLRDDVRGVRVEAALTYADVRDLLPREDIRAFTAAANEYRQAMLTGASMPDAMANLAEFESGLGNSAAADRYFQHAVRLDPELAIVRHAYGLFLVRAGQADAAFEQLQLAAELAPTNARFVYVYAVAQNSLGHSDAAIKTLRAANRDFPDDFDIAWALSTMLRDRGEVEFAIDVALELQQRFPDNANIETLLQSLRRN